MGPEVYIYNIYTLYIYIYCIYIHVHVYTMAVQALPASMGLTQARPNYITILVTWMARFGVSLSLARVSRWNRSIIYIVIDHSRGLYAIILHLYARGRMLIHCVLHTKRGIWSITIL